MSEDKLKAMRENLDKIDIEIQTLLIQRAKISLEVRATKQSDPLKIRPGREAEIIRNLISNILKKKNVMELSRYLSYYYY